MAQFRCKKDNVQFNGRIYNQEDVVYGKDGDKLYESLWEAMDSDAAEILVRESSRNSKTDDVKNDNKEKPLAYMNKEALLAKAKTLEIEVPADLTKKQIIELIEKKNAELGEK
ncbi:MAG: hypothetical protein LBF28_03335 [Rickettsiales bacterium]|jgi:hypothetical protein|nr:hypothetical protein [Rickettsiales bacterium]